MIFASIFRKPYKPSPTAASDEALFLPQSSMSCLSDVPHRGRDVIHATGVTIGSEFVRAPRPDQWQLIEETDTSQFYVLKKHPRPEKSHQEHDSAARLNSEHFLRAYLKKCRDHQSYLMDTLCIDDHLLAAGYIYYRWARVPADDYKKDELFFCALFLAWQMKEDSHKGEYEIIEYLYGETPRKTKSERKTMTKKAKRDYERIVKAYKLKIIQFMETKDKLWRQLNFRVNIEPELVWTVIQYFKKYQNVFDISRCSREEHFLLELCESDTELASQPEAD